MSAVVIVIVILITILLIISLISLIRLRRRRILGGSFTTIQLSFEYQYLIHKATQSAYKIIRNSPSIQNKPHILAEYLTHDIAYSMNNKHREFIKSLSSNLALVIKDMCDERCDGKLIIVPFVEASVAYYSKYKKPIHYKKFLGAGSYNNVLSMETDAFKICALRMYKSKYENRNISIESENDGIPIKNWGKVKNVFESAKDLNASGIDTSHIVKPLLSSVDFDHVYSRDDPYSLLSENPRATSNTNWMFVPQYEEAYLVDFRNDPDKVLRYVNCLINAANTLHVHGYVYFDWKTYNTVWDENNRKFLISDTDFVKVEEAWNLRTKNQGFIISTHQCPDEFINEIYSVGDLLTFNKYLRAFDWYIVIKDICSVLYTMMSGTNYDAFLSYDTIPDVDGDYLNGKYNISIHDQLDDELFNDEYMRDKNKSPIIPIIVMTYELCTKRRKEIKQNGIPIPNSTNNNNTNNTNNGLLNNPNTSTIPHTSTASNQSSSSSNASSTSYISSQIDSDESTLSSGTD